VIGLRQINIGLINREFTWQEIIEALEFEKCRVWPLFLDGSSAKSYKQRSSGVIYIPCPSYREMTPSCVLNPKTHKFHCYGCGIFGNKLDFVWLVTRLKPQRFFRSLLNDKHQDQLLL
jgi:hypothetical protein